MILEPTNSAAPEEQTDKVDDWYPLSFQRHAYRENAQSSRSNRPTRIRYESQAF